MGPVGTIVFGIGAISFLIGLILLLAGITSRGSMDTDYGRFSGPIWFIFMAFGIVISLVGVMMPF